MQDNIIPGADPDDSPREERDPEALRRELKEARREAARFRIKLRTCEARTAVVVLHFRPALRPDGSLIGFADLDVCGLVIFDVRLVRHEHGFAISWPMRQPQASVSFVPIMRPTPDLDARVLAAVLVAVFPEKVAS